MSDDSLKGLIAELGIAAFERTEDGAFQALAPAPASFRRLAQDTFPFLGHILDEANVFWRHNTSGTQEWGPCAATDEAGAEFHYLVTAAAAEGRQYLVFHIDRGSARTQSILQRVRESKLAEAADRRERTALATQARVAGNDVLEVIGKLVKTGVSPEQHGLLQQLSTLTTTIVQVANHLA
jgi:hypothetical protein